MPLKKDIVAAMQSQMPHHLKRDLDQVVDVILGAMVERLRADGRVEIRGFGSLSVRRQRPKLFKNPKTGKLYNIPERRRVIFKAGKDLRDL